MLINVLHIILKQIQMIQNRYTSTILFKQKQYLNLQ